MPAIAGRDHGAADNPSATITAHSEATPTDRHEQSRQERQVRLTAQDILSRNLRLPHASPRRWWNPWSWRGVYREPPWPGVRLNLNGALLLDVNLTNCRIAEADFTGAQFTGPASFPLAQFTDKASFDRAQFTGKANFAGAQFTGPASFGVALFTGPASFYRAQFIGTASYRVQFTGKGSSPFAQFIGTAFDHAKFTDETYFDRAKFTGPAYFFRVQFTGPASFNGVQFTGPASFPLAQFTDKASFDGAQFTDTHFNGAHASGRGCETVWPPGWTTRPAQPDKGEDPATRYLVRSEDPAGD